MSHPKGLEIARRLIAEEAEKRTGRLDLNLLGLSEIPEEIGDVEHLRELVLGKFGVSDLPPTLGDWIDNNQITDLKPLTQLVNLQSLNIHGLPVSNLRPLAQLLQLRSLDCSCTEVNDFHPLIDIPEQRHFNCSFTKITDLRALKALLQLNTLICGSVKVDDLGPLSELSKLTSLNCTFTKVKDVCFLRELHQLESLTCASMRINDLSPISQLSRLRALDCSFNSLCDILPLSQLPDLESLHCGYTKVTDLSPLSQLPKLQVLDCSGTQVRDLMPLINLSKLQKLDCSKTQVSDLSPLSKLDQLQSLSCSDTRVSDLTPLSQFSKLIDLDCSKTQIRDLSSLMQLSQLWSLGCTDTAVNDLSPLDNLSQLKSLDVSGTQVRDLRPMTSTFVWEIIANRCRLNSLPIALLEHSTLKVLHLIETDVFGVPAEVLSQESSENCLESLRSHVKDLQVGEQPIPDVKLIVLGNGRIGKTQICRRLRGEDFDPQIPSTHGILVSQASLDMRTEIQARLNIWDFGGQDLYHGTHALFMKTRAVFLVVWTPHSEKAEECEYGGMRFRNFPLPYWLEYVRHAAGDVCPVVLLQNQCDEPRDEAPQPPANTEDLKFPYLQIVHYSAQEDRKRDSLNEAIREAIMHLRGHEGIALIGKGRMQVREQLQLWIEVDSERASEKKQYRTLSQQQFQRLCDETGGVSSPTALLEYLHNTGIVFYREALFNSQIILDQNWAMDAIYTVFHRQHCYEQLRVLGGRFTRGLLEALAWKQYSLAEQELFLSMMQSCGICFVTRRVGPERNGVTEYVAPDLLPARVAVAGQLAGRWNPNGETVLRHWRYPFLNPTLVRNLISKIGSKAGETAVYWKYGVWVYEAETEACAILEQHMLDDRHGEIVVECQGHRANELLERITQWIEECNQQAGCRDVEGSSSARQNRLTRRLHGGPISNTGSQPEMQVSLRFADPPRPVSEKRACVSYAWKDERSNDLTRGQKVEQFCQRLSQCGFNLVRDTSDVRLGDRLSSFMRQIGTSDRVYVFLSDAYLKSPNCMYELLLIWETCGDDPDKFSDRIKVLFMPSTDIFSIPARMEYASYWKRQRDDIHQLIDESGVDVLGPTDLKNWKNIDRFAHHVDEMLAQIADRLQVDGFDEFMLEAERELTATHCTNAPPASD